VLRSHLQLLGISLRSATEPIDDTSTGELMKGVLAAIAQFDNDTIDRPRAAGWLRSQFQALPQVPNGKGIA
jgi:DNA invertase Pin-like site-specific DNA recombinase